MATEVYEIENAMHESNRSADELQKSNANLLRSNNELLQYAHIASHDLQEPLRKIEMFASILKESNTLADSDKVLIEKMVKSSNRMRLLITDLLEHAKVAKSEKMYRPVDLNEVVDQLLEDFELAIAEKKAVVHVEPLPHIEAAALEMNQLFYNLINNALKFSDHSRIPEISVKSKVLDSKEVAEFISDPKSERRYYDISISDNGIGFDPKYAEQIFLVFNKLHPKDVYPGSGIGLSICRSIVANHDGALFVESVPGKGSIFHIIIPQ